jgi:hypothetical protein
VRWNVVPYYISTAVKDGKASPREVREAAPYTQAFIDSLPNLRVVVFCGGMAKEAIPHLKLPKGVEALDTHHCAAQSFNHVRTDRAYVFRDGKKRATTSGPRLKGRGRWLPHRQRCVSTSCKDGRGRVRRSRAGTKCQLV